MRRSIVVVLLALLLALIADAFVLQELPLDRFERSDSDFYMSQLRMHPGIFFRGLAPQDEGM